MALPFAYSRIVVREEGIEPPSACEIILMALIEKLRSSRVERLGVCNWIRTSDLILTGDALNRLSYACEPSGGGCFLAPDPGVEPGELVDIQPSASVKKRVLVSVFIY